MAVITYGDSTAQMVRSRRSRPCTGFLTQRELGALVSWVHVLPFHPWTSDDGFAVLDYSSVNEALGTWSDITRLGVDYRLMADLVLNHCSSRSAWFENFRQGETPARTIFLSRMTRSIRRYVVRPRTSPLLNLCGHRAGRAGRLVHL